MLRMHSSQKKHLCAILMIVMSVSLFFSRVLTADEGDLAAAIRNETYKGRRYLVAGISGTQERVQNLAMLYGSPLRALQPTEPGDTTSNEVALWHEVRADLIAINQVGGPWTIFVLRSARPFFASLLESLGQGALANVQGTVYCYGFRGIDQELADLIEAASIGQLHVVFVG